MRAAVLTGIAGPALALFALAASAAPTATVRQGEVARWSGTPASECGFLGKRYPAVDGTCFFPIDMDAKTGVHEVALYGSDGTQKLGQLTVTKRECKEMDVKVPERFIDLSDENAALHAEQRARLLEALATRSGEPDFSLPLQPPSDPMPRGDDDFCAKRTFNDREYTSDHIGRDYEISQGTEIAAPANGTVLVAEDMFMTGNTVIIDHGAGLMSEFFHLARLDVKAGDSIERGASIGTVGSTGRSTGPHLHMGARWLEQRIDPAQLLAEPAELADLGKQANDESQVADGGKNQDDADLADAETQDAAADAEADSVKDGKAKAEVAAEDEAGKD